ncbi:hypothetical protein MNV49_003835 [Pseudohyphozyma bogoriensis]|nr:hypothetical protein MNV49_003835 [Pseudohyphozyma bogoriensis]
MPSKTTPRRNINSTPASPSTPSPSPRRAATATTSAVKERGPLPASAETSYHKRLRSTLVEHKRCRKEWNELVIRGLLQKSRAAIELWTDVEIGLKHIDSGKAGEKQQKSVVRTGYLFAQSAKLSDQLSVIKAVLESLAELLAKMNQLVEQTEALLLEAASTRGTAFAFRDPLWVTWPLSRFSDGLQDLTSHYRSSFTLLATLVDTLTTFPPLPSSSTDSASDPQSKSTEPPIERPKNEEIQAAMSLLAVQPLIPGKGGDGPEAWEEVMSVEVGGWS